MSNLLDTDWAIHYLNNNPRVMGRLDSLRPDGIAISIISIAELYEGIVNSSNPEDDERELVDFLRPFPIIDLEFPSAGYSAWSAPDCAPWGLPYRTWTCSSALLLCATT